MNIQKAQIQLLLIEARLSLETDKWIVYSLQVILLCRLQQAWVIWSRKNDQVRSRKQSWKSNCKFQIEVEVYK